MARQKLSPRLALPSPGLPEQSTTAHHSGGNDSDEDASGSIQSVISEVSQHTQRLAHPELSHVNKSQQSTTITQLPQQAAPASSSELPSQIGRASKSADLICPQCCSDFPDMGIMDFREHVESCTRPTTGNSESGNSSLSPPPESQRGFDELDGGREVVHIPPYDAGVFTFYPEQKSNVTIEDALEVADGQQRTKFLTITDPSKFSDLLEGAEDMPYDDLYRRVCSAQQALVTWQNEWMDLDDFIRTMIPPPPSKDKDNPVRIPNPRMPKPHLTGLGYRDQHESFVYGYEHNSHPSALGLQKPEQQRYVNGTDGRRELRQRVPTQKAVEAEISTTPDSEDGNGGRRRGRGRRARENTIDTEGGGGRIKRTASRFESESRGQTPTTIMKTFPSGKKIGRPAKAKGAGGSRLQELQLEHGSQNDSASESSRVQDDRTSEQPVVGRKRVYDLGQAIETTEQWDEDTDEMISRPTTSGSNMTGNSTDDMDVHLTNYRSRRRQNTSDFEDALPSYKRIGRRVNTEQTNGLDEAGTSQPQKNGNPAEKGKGRKARPGEIQNTDLIATTVEPSFEPPTKAAKNKENNVIRKAQASKDKSLSNSAPTDRSTSKQASVKVKKAGTESKIQPKNGKDGTTRSRASENMVRRWAAKKEAEALGLPVPKIGRYPKGSTAHSITSDAAGTGDQVVQSQQVSGRKRKRDENGPNSVENGDADAGSSEAPIKKRGGRPKKVFTKLETPPNAESVAQLFHNGSADLGGTFSNNEGDEVLDPALIGASKKKAGRSKKQHLKAQTAVMKDMNIPVTGQVESEKSNLDETGNSMGGRPNVNAATTSISAPGESLTNETNSIIATNEFQPVQAQLARTSTRVTRQTSAALSSQAGTRGSSMSSHIVTATPTPTLVDEPLQDPAIKTEPVASATLPRKRIRAPKTAQNVGSVEAAPISVNGQDDDGPPTKKRRIGRPPKAVSTENTPPLVNLGLDGEPVVRDQAGPSTRPGLRKRHTPVLMAPPSDIVISAQAVPAEPSRSKKSAGRVQNDTNARGSSTITDGSGENDVQAIEPITTRARGARKASNPHIVSASDSIPENMIANAESTKKKSNWSGKRVMGESVTSASSSSTKGPRMHTTMGLDGADDREDFVFEVMDNHTAPETPTKSAWSGHRMWKSAPGHMLSASTSHDEELLSGMLTSNHVGLETLNQDPSKKKREKKGGWGGRRIKGERVSTRADELGPSATGTHEFPMEPSSKGVSEEVVKPKLEAEIDAYDSEAAEKARKKEAAKISKSLKMSRSMKDRWADGSMHEIMRKKKASNLARKAAAALVDETGEDRPVVPASAPAKRKITSLHDPSGPQKRRRTMNGTMDGAADSDSDEAVVDRTSYGRPSSSNRRMSEFERYQQIASPLRSSHGKRQRRPAALRASQSFSKFTDDGEEEEQAEMNEEDDVETELKKQFDSEYDHFKALTSPDQIPGVLTGKRKRKPVINLEEAMRIEAGDDDDFLID